MQKLRTTSTETPTSDGPLSPLTLSLRLAGTTISKCEGPEEGKLARNEACSTARLWEGHGGSPGVRGEEGEVWPWAGTWPGSRAHRRAHWRFSGTRVPLPVNPETISSPLAESPGISEVAIVSALQNKRCQRSKGKMLRGPYAPVGPEHKSTFNLL